MYYSRVYINVYERDGMPVYNCLVQLISHKRVYNKYTDKCGIASFYIPYGKYLLIIKHSKKHTVIIKDKVYLIRIKDINSDNNIVFGQVLDKYKRPINKASVILYRQYYYMSTPVDFTKTDRFGIYIFRNISKGTYYVKVCK